jgi:hypothetical protein
MALNKVDTWLVVGKILPKKPPPFSARRTWPV